MFKGTAHSKFKTCTLRALAFLLLVLYAAGGRPLEVLHDWVHDHATVHVASQEQDPCHRAIYHGDTEHSCGHALHLVASDKCHMCDLVYYGDQIWVGSAGLLMTKFEHDFLSFYCDNLNSFAAVISSSRAPPILF